MYDNRSSLQNGSGRGGCGDQLLVWGTDLLLLFPDVQGTVCAESGEIQDMKTGRRAFCLAEKKVSLCKNRKSTETTCSIRQIMNAKKVRIAGKYYVTTNAILVGSIKVME